MRDYIAAEFKKVREELLKLHLDVESKLKEKIDTKDTDVIESKIYCIKIIRENT